MPSYGHFVAVIHLTEQYDKAEEERWRLLEVLIPDQRAFSSLSGGRHNVAWRAFDKRVFDDSENS